jgi:hypothetical protein
MTDEATAPRRLRAADVIDTQQRIIEQLTQRSSEPYVTVEHTLNAKGDTQTSVKVSAPMGHDVDALHLYAREVEKVAADIYVTATLRYPRTNGETK